MSDHIYREYTKRLVVLTAHAEVVKEFLERDGDGFTATDQFDVGLIHFMFRESDTDSLECLDDLADHGIAFDFVANDEADEDVCWFQYVRFTSDGAKIDMLRYPADLTVDYQILQKLLTEQGEDAVIERVVRGWRANQVVPLSDQQTEYGKFYRMKQAVMPKKT